MFAVLFNHKVTHLLPTTMGNRTTLTILPILTTMLWNISAQSNITPTNSRMKPTSSSLLMRTIIKLWQRLSQNDLTTGKSRHNQENRNILLPSSETKSHKSTCLKLITEARAGTCWSISDVPCVCRLVRKRCALKAKRHYRFLQSVMPF